jgi:polysaccharide export outer membrane protein
MSSAEEGRGSGLLKEIIMRKSMPLLLSAMVLWIVLGPCLPSAGQDPQEKMATEYRLGAKDLLEIKVLGEDKLSTTVRVSEEGKITFPYLGEILVDGLTAAQLEKTLSRLLEEKYIINPQVKVSIKEFRSKRVSILGAIGRQGSYELLGRTTLLEILAEAGGLARDAGKEIIIIRQQADGSNVSLKIPVEDLMQKGEAKLNLVLEPNDIINIPADQLVQIYVYGQVKSPGAIQVLKSNIPTLVRAIAQAGGFTERAAKGSVVIRRKDALGNEKEIKVNVKNIQKNKSKDIQLQPDDVVFVPETIF